MCGPIRRGRAPAQRAVQREYDVQQPFTFLRLSGLRPLAQDAASCLKMLLKFGSQNCGSCDFLAGVRRFLLSCYARHHTATECRRPAQRGQPVLSRNHPGSQHRSKLDGHRQPQSHEDRDLRDRRWLEEGHHRAWTDMEARAKRHRHTGRQFKKVRAVPWIQAGSGADFRPTNIRRDRDHGLGNAYRPWCAGSKADVGSDAGWLQCHI